MLLHTINLSSIRPRYARDEFEDPGECLGLDVVADGADEDGDAAVVGAELVVVGEAQRRRVRHLAQDRAHRGAHPPTLHDLVFSGMVN